MSSNFVQETLLKEPTGEICEEMDCDARPIPKDLCLFQPRTDIPCCFDILPDELLMWIFSFLHGRDVCLGIQRSCRRWNSLASDDHLWTTIVSRSGDFCERDLREKPATKSWKWLYLSRKLVLKKASSDATHQIPPNAKVGRLESRDWIYEGDLLQGKENGFGRKMWVEQGMIREDAAERSVPMDDDIPSSPSAQRNESLPTAGERIAVYGPKRTPQWEFTTKSYYVGEWKDGKEHGKGTRHFDRGHYYSGEWKNGERDGNGEYYWLNGTFYVGQFRDGFRHGQGAYTWGPNSKYVGEWEKGIEHGHGLRTWTDGDQYEGDWVRGTRTGFGVYTWPNGSSYEGGWVKCTHEGEGVYRWPDGREYRGQFKNNKKNDYGVYLWPDGTKYAGSWQNGVRHGKGLMEWADGSSFEGEWIQDSRGRGMYRSKDTKGDAQLVEFDEGRRWVKKYEQYFDMPTDQWEILHLPEINRLVAEKKRKQAEELEKRKQRGEEEDEKKRQDCSKLW